MTSQPCRSRFAVFAGRAGSSTTSTWIAPAYRNPPEPDLPDPSPTYRSWIIRYALRVAALRVERVGHFTLAQVRDELLDLGLLDGWDRYGDMWLMQLAPLGDYVKRASTQDQWVPRRPETFEADAYAEPPMPPPPCALNRAPIEGIRAGETPPAPAPPLARRKR